MKLELPGSLALATLPTTLGGLTASPLEVRRLHTVYYDSDDFRLTRWSCSLRYRAHEGWRLKLPGAATGPGVRCEEHAFSGAPPDVPRDALALAAAYLRGASVRPVAELRTVRSLRRLTSESGAELAELVEDDVRVVEGARIVRRFRQIELELCDGAPREAIAELAAALRRAGTGAKDPTPKFLQALGHMVAEPELPHVRVNRKSNLGDVVSAAFAVSVERLIHHDAGIRLGESEAVHQGRVAVRRLRSDLHSFEPLLDGAWACALRKRLKWLSDALGAARDADVLLRRLQAHASALPATDCETAKQALATFERAREAAYSNVRTALHSDRYLELLDDVVAAAKAPRMGERAGLPALEAVPLIMGAAWEELRTCVAERTEPPSDAELHRIRLKAKRVRYAAEAVAPTIGRPASRLARRLARLQDILGEQHDAAVSEARLRQVAASGHTAFVAGEIASREREVAQKGREKWSAAWRKASRQRRLFWTGLS